MITVIGLLTAGLALLLWPARPSGLALPRASTHDGGADRAGAPGPRNPRRIAAGAEPEPYRSRLGEMVRRIATPGFGAVRRRGRITAAAVPAAGALALTMVLSWPVAVAAGMAGATARRLVRRARRDSRSRADLVAVTAALHALARDLQAGTPPAQAVRAVARSAPPRVSAVLTDLPGVPPRWAESTGADRARPGQGSPALLDVRSRLRSGWELSAAHGIPLAAVVMALADDLADRARAAESRSAQVAGPAVSGYVLSALPVAGLLLGAGMGADPLGVLLGSPVGGVLLLAGTALCCTGLAWADRIVRG